MDDVVGIVLEKRQDEGNSTDPDDPPPPPTTSTTERQPPPTSTTDIPEPPPVTSTTSTSTRSTTTRPPPPPPDDDDDEPTTSTTSTSTTSPPNDDNDDDKETSTTEEPTASTTLITTTRVREVTVVITISGTPTTSIGYTSEASVIVSTPTSRNDDGTSDEGEGGGISKSTKNTIIGVVVGVGGSIIIGALAIVAYRLRKKKTAGGFGDEAGASPVSAGSSRPDAFKATLDQYHKPPGTVNPSANF